MRLICRPIFTRKRLLTSAALIVAGLLAGWLGARHSIARWAVHRALAAAGLEPASFQIQSVGLSSLQVADLSVGASKWLTAGGMDVTYSPADLLAGRVATIGVRDARWTVQVRDGAIDWGFVPKKSAGPLTLALPFDRLDLRESVIRVIVDDVAHEIPLTGRLTPAAPDGIACRLDLLAMGQTVSLTAQARTTADLLTVEVAGDVGHPAAVQWLGRLAQALELAGDVGHPAASATDVPAAVPDPAPAVSLAEPTMPAARFNATLLRAHDDGSIQIDVTAELESLAGRAGDLEIGFSQASLGGHILLDGRGQVNDMTASILVQNLRAGDLAIRSFDLTAAKIDGPQLQLEAAASGEGWQLPEARGTVHWGTEPDSSMGPTRSAIFTVGMQTSKPVSVNWESAGISGILESIAGNMKVQVDGLGLTMLEGSLTMNGGSLQAGDLTLSDAHADVVMQSSGAVEVTSLAATVGDGATISAAPFTLDSRAPQIQTRLSMSNLSLAEWLPLITSDHATGQGRVSGYMDVSIDWITGAARLGHLSGSLRSDPQHGFIQATDADALGALLDAQDPRFATDEVLRPVRDKMVDALRDFAFSTLTVDLSRRDDQTVAVAHLSGFGRHGDDPQGLNLTLDLHAQDAFLDLISRFAARSSMTDAAENALDQFFHEAPTSEEAHP